MNSGIGKKANGSPLTKALVIFQVVAIIVIVYILIFK